MLVFVVLASLAILLCIWYKNTYYENNYLEGFPEDPIILCFLTVRPSIQFYEFVKDLQSPSYHVYICIDDELYIPHFPAVTIINIAHKEAEENGFKSSVLYFPDKAVSRDKALYYFCTMGIPYSKIWFIEEDVFIPTLHTISDIDEKYPSADLLVEEHTHKTDGDTWPHWKHVNDTLDLPLPWLKGMICAVRVSKALMDSIQDYVDKKKRLAFDEVMFNTLAEQNNLTVVTPKELSTIQWRTRWKLEDIKKENLYHPVKEFDTHIEWHNNL